MVYIGKGGYWEGRADGKQGWFPALSIREMGEDEDFDIGESEYSSTVTS